MTIISLHYALTYKRLSLRYEELNKFSFLIKGLKTLEEKATEF